MKRVLAVLLLILLTLQVTSCIQLKPEYRAEEPNDGTAHDGTETLAPADALDAVFPSWSDVEKNAKLFLTATENPIVDATDAAYSYTDMATDLQILANAYPTHLSYRSIGKSVAGRDIYLAVLGNPDAPRQIVVSAGIHAREYMTPLLVMKQIEYILAYRNDGACNGFSYASILEKYCFYIVPMSNPDGIMLSQEGLSSLSDTELCDKIFSIYYADFAAGITNAGNVNEYLKYWKANAAGTDLNRNFDALWEEYDRIFRPSCQNYKGPSAASEPETQALVTLTESLNNIQAVLCIHSQGEVLYWDCGQNAALSEATRAFTAMIAARNGYYIVDEQNNDASYSDWCALEKGLIAVTVETGTGSCPLPIEQFETIWSDNFDLLLLSAVYFE
ncbi:MAG: peptidase [Clostridia bacterium]|nr:peptidase [Clostridia bacterium]